MEKIDVFAHVLLPNYYGKMLEICPDIAKIYAFTDIESLKNMEIRRKLWNEKTRQVVSYANINAEDYCAPDLSAELCREANQELADCVSENSDMFAFGVGMLPFNNIEQSLKILEEIKNSDQLVGVQVFTRHLGKSIADPSFRTILKKCEELGLLILLHPVFDDRKPDNNIVFSWEYELSQAMMQLVKTGIFKDCPGAKIIVHHAGAMVPFFAGRINNILKAERKDFKKFYVDTAILGNSKALELTVDYFGVGHVLYGTDAPFGIAPNGATREVEDAINALPISENEKGKIFCKNLNKLIKVANSKQG